MIRLATRAVALLLVAPFLTLASALAPLHVHEPGPGQPGHDHGHALAHSHFDPHHLEAHRAGDREIEHDGERVVWLDSSILHTAPCRAVPVPPSILISYEIVPVALGSVTLVNDVAPAHGPPRRAHLFRGPPPPRLS